MAIFDPRDPRTHTPKLRAMYEAMPGPKKPLAPLPPSGYHRARLESVRQEIESKRQYVRDEIAKLRQDPSPTPHDSNKPVK